MPDPSPSPARRTRRGPVLAALVLAMFMAAIEGTIVATAMPSIAGSLGGFALYGWVFASYLLMQAATTPMFGKLADLFGRKSVFTLGVAVFLAGSVACGFATSMPWLIAFRFVQGAGAGAVQPVTNTLAGDLFAFRERARVQGWLASVWGFSAILGPLAGGLIVEHAHWAWIFWANVPFGLLALGLVATYLHEDVRRTERRIDHAGAVTFFVGIAALITVLTQFGTFPAWLSLALLALSTTSLSFFAWHETRAPDAMMPPDLWRDRLVTTANLGTLGAGIVMIAVISYLPTYAQGVLGTSALVAGFTLTTMSMGWPLAAVVAGRLMVRVGVRTTVRAGGIALVLGATGFALLDRVREAWFAAAASAIIGVGMGLLITTFLVSVQTRVSWHRRGAATATNALMRILGNALGAALLGGVVNASLTSFLRREGLAGQVSLDDVTRLLTERAAADPALLERVSTGLAQGLDRAFLVMLVFAVITLAICLAMPDLRPEETRGRPTETSGPRPPENGGDRGPDANQNRRPN
ncbi:MAG: MDR family MFS transporter [Trueperaceae bacterium]|nr:MDR family MFS transporter [Trueperaceae bacterium]